MNQQETNKQAIIEDLPVDEARQDEVKGGLLEAHKYRALVEAATGEL